MTTVQESLQYLHPTRGRQPDLKDVEAPTPELEQPEAPVEKKPAPKEKKRKKQEPKQESKEEPPKIEVSADADSEEVEQSVLKVISGLEGDNGAAWDEIMKKCKKAGLAEDQIEEALTSLMDKGMIYEPILGTIKTT
jgi:hypothetical protein